MDQSDLPNIPGFRVSIDKRNKFHKTHLFDICNGIPVTDIKRNGINNISPSELENQIICKQQRVSTPTSTSTSTLPKWVQFDRKVLRFYSFFKENVFNSAIEKERIRKCIIYYFLEDDTFMINEMGHKYVLETQLINDNQTDILAKLIYSFPLGRKIKEQ